MAESGDPLAPQDGEDLDAAVGFVSAASLAGRVRLTEPAAAPDRLSSAAPRAIEDPEFGDLTVSDAMSSPMTASVAAGPGDGSARHEASESDRVYRSRRQAPPSIEGSMGLYAVYALILFSVPTLGVSALIGLLAVTGRPAPSGEVARSHFIFQQRTLWAAAVIALLGLILIVVNIGVFVLFALALWVMVRGAFGVWRLKAGRPISDPRHWLI